MTEKEHQHILDFSRDQVNDEYEEQAWACVKCGEKIFVKGTEWSNTFAIVLGSFLGFVGAVSAILVGQFLH